MLLNTQLINSAGYSTGFKSQKTLSPTNNADNSNNNNTHYNKISKEPPVNSLNINAANSQSTKNKLKISINKNYMKSPINPELRSNKTLMTGTYANLNSQFNSKEKDFINNDSINNNKNNKIVSANSVEKQPENIGHDNDSKQSNNLHKTKTEESCNSDNKQDYKPGRDMTASKATEQLSNDSVKINPVMDCNNNINRVNNDLFRSSLIRKNELISSLNNIKAKDIKFKKNIHYEFNVKDNSAAEVYEKIHQSQDSKEDNKDNINQETSQKLNKGLLSNNLCLTDYETEDEELNNLALSTNQKVLEFIANKLVENSIRNMENVFKIGKAYY